MKNFKDKMSKSLFGRDLSSCIKEEKCVTCGEKVISFKDTLSKKEYFISGMCQKCQDEVFN